MIVFVRSYVSNLDGKAQKYFLALNKLGLKYHFLGWDRTGSFQENTNETLYKRRGYIGGGFKNIINLVFWNFFILFTLIKHRKDVEVVHSIDLDTGVASFLYCKVFSKKIIFDIYDKYSDTHNINGVLKVVVDKIENFIITHSDVCILADESRLTQHKIKKMKNIIILENVPKKIELSSSSSSSSSSKIKLGYFGVLEREHRGLEDLILAVSNNSKFELHIIGYGPLSEDIEKNVFNNIIYYGSKKSDEGLEIMSTMDILVGMYYKTIENHFFAAPNKYFEHLMLGKAFLTTIGTPPGMKTIKFNTGWALDEGEFFLKKFLDTLDQNEVTLMSSNAKKIWDEKYETYYEEYYVELYGGLIKGFKS